MSIWSLQLEGKVFDGVEVIPTSHVDMKDKILNLDPRCRGGRTTDAKGWLKRGGGSRALVGSRGEVGMRRRGTLDIHYKKYVNL